ncbi:hypothetical protein E8E13_009031 [Curvularia kusanoi]|uniref:Major facilitator superfamily (MFS) profile domain-containing protein n=1 Tax=Curvularia kusanoi TaxID=90978 RepID=A0A9P4WD12_CURKU|nr:hypothetical protein E8E13_009031 [Curvularia kusanoi]
MARFGSLSTSSRGKTPFPYQQMAILALCRICEPIAFMSIFPYAFKMVESFGVEESQQAMYTGMVTSAFAFAECGSGFFWGRLSDKVGRKKVLLGGMFGTGLSMLLFGFATSLPMALFARALGGLLNGNIGVLQTTVAELITDERHQPRAYSIMPFVWCLGTIIGGALGGVLAQPALSSDAFKGTIFETYPFLLPNVICAMVVVLGLAVGILFLQETHEDIKYDEDRGLEAGKWLLRKVWSQESKESFNEKDASLDEMTRMLEDHDINTHAYRSTDSSPTLCSTRTSMSEPPVFSLDQEKAPAPPVRHAFTKQVCLNIMCVGILAFHTISLEQLLPILMSRDEFQPGTEQLPFKFEGGFGWSLKNIGGFLALQGAIQMVTQIFLFPWLSKRLGSLRTFWITMSLYPILYILAPYLALLPEKLRIPGLMVLLIGKVTFQSLSYPSLNIILANSSPSKRVLGTVNGAAASSASICRGFGPTVAGAVDGLGLQLHMSGLAWWAIACVALLGWVPGLMMKESIKHTISEDDEEALVDCASDAESILTLTPDEEAEMVLSK